MNILIATDNLFPDVMGGSGRVVAETGKHLAQRGHNVHVVTRRVGNTATHSTMDGISVYRYEYGGSVFATLRSILRILRSQALATEFDIVLICQPFVGIAVLCSGKLRNVPKLRDFYGPWHDEYRVKTCGWPMGKIAFCVKMNMSVRRCLDRYVLRQVDGVRVLSQYTEDMVKVLCPSVSDRIKCIPGGVDSKRFVPAYDVKEVRRRLNLPENSPIVFTVRNLTARMGLDVLINAMGQVVEQFCNAILVIGGEGPMHGALLDQVKRCGLTKNVMFKGKIQDSELPFFYQSADVFVLPTQDLEGFGLVTLEAMSSGVPVVATPQGGSVEILSQLGQNFLCDGKDAKHIAKNIINFLGKSKDERDYLGRALMNVASEYSWEEQAKTMEEMMFNIVKKQKCEKE